jgi:hypothetical protein
MMGVECDRCGASLAYPGNHGLGSDRLCDHCYDLMLEVMGR